MIDPSTIQHLYDADNERKRLAETLVLMYLAMLTAAQRMVKQVLRLNVPDLTIDASAVRRAVLQAGARAVMIDATTQKLIAQTIAQGQMLGLSNWEIANGTADGSFGGIEGLFSQTWKGRAEMIVRTELQQAMLDATVDRLQASGVVKWVRATDGDFDKSCAARNGRIYPINNPPQLLHPHCRLTVAPSEGPA